MLVFGLLLPLFGCSDDDYSPSTSTGRVNLSLDVDPTVLSVASRASYDDIWHSLTADDFFVRLVSASGEVVVNCRYGEFGQKDVKVGEYTLEAYYGTKGEEGFEKAYFVGSSPVTVVTGETAEVAVSASLANAAVKVNYTDAFKQYMTSYSAAIRTEGSTEDVAYPADATDELFVNPGNASVNVTFTTPKGQTATLKAAEFTTRPRHIYNVTIDVNNGQMGDAVLTVSFDDTAAMAEPVEIVLSDELLNAPAPIVTLDAAGATGNEASFDIIEGTSQNAVMNIVARGGLSEVIMTTSGSGLLTKEWPASVDLLKADAAMQARLAGLGLSTRGLWKNPDQMAVVDFTNVLANINATSDPTVFTIRVVDRYGKISEPQGKITVTTRRLEFSIDGQNVFLSGDDEATVNVSYNGADLKRDVQFTYYTDRDTWADAEIISVTPASRAAAQYAVRLRLTGGANDVKIRAKVTGQTSAVDYTVKRTIPEFSLANAETDNYARHASVTLKAADMATAASLASAATWQLSTDGGKTFVKATPAVSGAVLTFSGLTPSTNYVVRAVAGSVSHDVALTTEAATQLVNGNFETAPTIDGSQSHWENYVFTGWGTNNPMTSKLGKGSNSEIATNYGYDRISGTKPTNDSHSGSAVVVSTQGWGAGNTAVSGVSGKCKYIDPGLLHLGSDRSVRPSGFDDRPGPLTTTDLTCGIAFASRPSSISFWYKYAQKSNEDYGTALVEVYDASGAVIATGSLNLTPQASYKQVSIGLNYTKAAKAAKIYVRFLSTHDSKFLQKDDSVLNGPGWGNTTRGEYSGSRLYLDDVTLNY